MKILQINSVYKTGSTGNIVFNIGECITNDNIKSYIAYGIDTIAPQGNTTQIIKIGSKFDLFKHKILSKFFDLHGFGSKLSTIKFINKIDLINPDIIHLHNIHGYYLNIEILFNYLKQKKIPVIWTLHDCWSFTGHCAYFDFKNCLKWKSECKKCPQISSYPNSYLIDNSLNNYNRKQRLFTEIEDLTLVPVSSWLESLIKQSFLQKKRTIIIHNGIDLNIFYPRISYKKDNNIFVILGVASPWSKRKGLDDFLAISSKLNSDFQIIIIGLNNKQLKTLPSNIIGIKRTENLDKLADYYSQADVFINPTYEDNFPTTNLEALACGTPVITYRTGGSPEAIDEKTGIVVGKGDINGLLSAINTIKTNGKEYYSNSCILRARRLFNKEDKFKEYINLYKSIINK